MDSRNTLTHSHIHTFNFVYHGFRYVEISGLPEGSKPSLSDFTGLVLYDQMASTSNFETDNPVINTVHRNAFWGIRGNYRSMPTDCPQRDERMGWTGDRTTGCYGESFLFNNHRLYAPPPAYWRNYTDNLTWPGALITVADMLYTRFGDIEPIRRHYDAMRKWLLHMRLWYCKEGIMTRDCYGDWCMPPESPEMIHSKDPSRITEAPAISTPFYCYLCNIMKSFAIRLGKNDDADFFQQEFDTITAIYNSRYLDTLTANYANGTVTANILPLWFGMVPGKLEDKVFANIIDKMCQPVLTSHISHLRFPTSAPPPPSHRHHLPLLGIYGPARRHHHLGTLERRRRRRTRPQGSERPIIGLDEQRQPRDAPRRPAHLGVRIPRRHPPPRTRLHHHTAPPHLRRRPQPRRLLLPLRQRHHREPLAPYRQWHRLDRRHPAQHHRRSPPAFGR